MRSLKVTRNHVWAVPIRNWTDHSQMTRAPFTADSYAMEIRETAEPTSDKICDVNIDDSKADEGEIVMSIPAEVSATITQDRGWGNIVHYSSGNAYPLGPAFHFEFVSMPTVP